MEKITEENLQDLIVGNYIYNNSIGWYMLHAITPNYQLKICILNTGELEEKMLTADEITDGHWWISIKKI